MSFFTVIIPLYNKENFIQKTIESVLNQSFDDFEILIIEDCSTDNSKMKVLEIQSNKIKLIQHLQNKGLSASRNTGIQNASSDYIAFLDADDVWKENYLETLFSLIRKYPEARLFATNYAEIYNDKTTIINNQKVLELGNDFIVSNFFELNLGKPIYIPSSLCVAKEVFEKVGLFDEKITYTEDVDFNIRANISFHLAYSPNALVNYNLFIENQMSTTDMAGKTFADFSGYEKQFPNNKSLKKYLDFNRYVLVRMLQNEKESEKSTILKGEIDFKNLNFKQQLLLKIPQTIVTTISKLKKYLTKKGIMVSSYD
ncbi:glycosyltransferase family 2 protein [Flavobacterium sp.]